MEGLLAAEREGGGMPAEGVSIGVQTPTSGEDAWGRVRCGGGLAGKDSHPLEAAANAPPPPPPPETPTQSASTPHGHTGPDEVALLGVGPWAVTFFLY